MRAIRPVFRSANQWQGALSPAVSDFLVLFSWSCFHVVEDPVPHDEEPFYVYTVHTRTMLCQMRKLSLPYSRIC